MKNIKKIINNGLIHAKGGGGGSSTTTTSLDPIQKRALASVLDKSEALYDKGPLNFFPGETVAQVDPNTMLGQNLQLGAAGSALSMLPGTLDAWQRGLNADLVNNPLTEQIAQAATRPIERQFMEQTLPSIQSSAIQHGAFGGDRQDILTGMAARDMNQSVLDTRANIYSDANRAGMAQQANMLNLLPTLQQGLLNPSAAITNVGLQRQAEEQALIDAARERFEFNEFEPESQLDRFQNRVTGVNLGGMSSTKSKGGGK